MSEEGRISGEGEEAEASRCVCLKGGSRNIERGGARKGGPGALPPKKILSIEFLVSVLFFTPLNGKLQF